MSNRIQGAALVAFSGFSIWLVAAYDYIQFRGGSVISYIVAGLGMMVGLAMLITGENPLRRGAERP